MNLSRKNQVNNLTEENNTEIKVFGNDDESLRVLGQLLSSETSRKIIQLLTQEEMYTNQISKRLGIQMNITVFHLKKLVDVGLVIVTHKKIVKKGIDHKYYKMIPNIFVTSTQPKKEVHENGFLKKFFKDGIKFVAIGLSIIATWFSAIYNNSISRGDTYEEEAVTNDPTIVILILCGLLVAFIIKIKKRKKD